MKLITALIKLLDFLITDSPVDRHRLEDRDMYMPRGITHRCDVNGRISDLEDENIYWSKD